MLPYISLPWHQKWIPETKSPAETAARGTRICGVTPQFHPFPPLPSDCCLMDRDVVQRVAQTQPDATRAAGSGSRGTPPPHCCSVWTRWRLSKRTHRDQGTYLSSLLGNNPEILPGIQDSIFITGEKTGMWGQSGSLWGSRTHAEQGSGEQHPQPHTARKGCSSIQTARVAQHYCCSFTFLTSGCCTSRC